MIRRMAYKFRLRVKPRVETLFRQFAGCAWYVYNCGLALQQDRYERGEKKLTYAGLCKELTAWRHDPETIWLADAPAQVLQQALRNLDRAFTGFFEKRAALPAFKKKGKSVDSFRYADAFAVDANNGRVKLPKVGWVRYRNSRRVLGTPKNLTISRQGKHWFVSIQVEQTVPDPVHPNPESAVGVDVGVVNFAALSNGEVIPPLNAYRGIEKKLARQQRRLSRKVKFSNRWKKQKERVAKLHRKAANRRKDYLHKISNDLSKKHATVFVEDLQVKSMSASAKGTVEEPGRMVRQKAGLNKAILDQAWGELFRQLGYKCEWRGGKLVARPAPYTSQRCPGCLHTAPENRPTRDRFCCVRCGLAGPADTIASLNVLADGQSATARGGNGSEPRGESPWLARPDEARTNGLRPGIPCFESGGGSQRQEQAARIAQMTAGADTTGAAGVDMDELDLRR